MKKAPVFDGILLCASSHFVSSETSTHSVKHLLVFCHCSCVPTCIFLRVNLKYNTRKGEWITSKQAYMTDQWIHKKRRKKKESAFVFLLHLLWGFLTGIKLRNLVFLCSGYHTMHNKYIWQQATFCQQDLLYIRCTALYSQMSWSPNSPLVCVQRGILCVVTYPGCISCLCVLNLGLQKLKDGWYQLNLFIYVNDHVIYDSCASYSTHFSVIKFQTIPSN